MQIQQILHKSLIATVIRQFLY